MSDAIRTVTRTRRPDGTAETEHELAQLAQDSLEVCRTAKGEITWAAKVYGKDDEEVEARMAALLNKADGLVRRAREVGA